MTMTHPVAPSFSTGARLATPRADKTLPLSGCVLRVSAHGGLARVELEQRFENPYDEPLALSYTLPLPADAAVSGFSFEVGDEIITGEIERRGAARERFERALATGHSAALVEQERSSLFTQEVGNVPPKTAVVTRIAIDQPLRFRADGRWEWRFPLAAAPRYLGRPGVVADAEAVTVDVSPTPLSPRCRLSLEVRDALTEGRSPESPSHPLSVRVRGSGADVELGDGGAVPLDRDVVVRWAVARPTPAVTLDAASPEGGAAAGEAHALLTVVPPDPDRAPTPIGRDLILLLDVSGSMGGEPLEQARRVSSALVDSLAAGDTLEMVAFSSHVVRWRAGPVPADDRHKREAMSWLSSLVASGGTEMLDGIVAALAGIRPGAQRQIVLVTDGLIGFESEVVGAILKNLPASSRLHTLGVGSSVNRSLLGPAARAGHGVETIVGLGEDPERAAGQLLARTQAPLVVDLSVEGDAVLTAAPRRAPDLFAGAPAMIAVQIRPAGGTLRLVGRTSEGPFTREIAVPPTRPGSGSAAVTTFFARQRIEDLELDHAAGGAPETIDATIEELSLRYGVQSRLTSWIAVTREATVDPSRPTRREQIPQNLPFGMSAEGLGLRAAPPAPAAAGYYAPPPMMGGAPPPPPGSSGPMRTRAIAPPMMGRAAPGAPPPPRQAPARPAAPPLPSSRTEQRAKEKKADVADESKSIDAIMPAPAAAPSPAKAPAPAEAAAGVRGQDALREEAAAPAPSLRGAVRFQSDDELIVEITLDVAIEWDPEPFGVYIEHPSRAAIGVTIDRALTTAAGAYGPGQTIRLVLRRLHATLSVPTARVCLWRPDGEPTWYVEIGG